jgi:hypothetical protein
MLQAAKFLVDEAELRDMKSMMERLNAANSEREIIISELEKRLHNAIQINEILNYKVNQYESLSFDNCLKLTNEELVNNILQLQSARSFWHKPPSWLVYSSAVTIIPVTLLLVHFASKLKLNWCDLCYCANERTIIY